MANATEDDDGNGAIIASHTRDLEDESSTDAAYAKNNSIRKSFLTRTTV
jgi:hypothetical protein